jgi:hypothetical protein
VGGRLIAAAIAVALVVGLAAAGGYLQYTYPGGVTQWATDVTGPPRLSPADMRAAVHKALVTTVADTWRGKATTQGSAFFLQGGTTVVTAARLLPQPLVKLAVLDSAGTSTAADLLIDDPTTDVAVLRVDGMSVTPLERATHPLYRHSRVFLGGSVVSGEVVNTDYTAKHLLLVSVGPVASAMSGAPVVDEWGRVIGLIQAGTPDGKDAMVIPLRTIAPIVAAAARVALPMYVGPPLITTPATQLVLGPGNFPNRNAKAVGAQVSFSIGVFIARSRYERGNLFVAVYTSIAGAAAAAADCRSNLDPSWPSVANSVYALGDGGILIRGSDKYGDALLLLCWSDRNALAVWWVNSFGYDESSFFPAIANKQEQVFQDAS